jgi:hypothetical protein
MSKCILSGATRRKKRPGFTDKLKDLETAFSILKRDHHSVYDKLYKGQSYGIDESLNTFLERATGGYIKSSKELNKLTDKQKKGIDNVADTLIANLSKAEGVNLLKSERGWLEGEQFANMYKVQRKLYNFSGKLHKAFNAVVPKVLQGLLYYDIQKQFRQINPIGKRYSIYMQNQNRSEHSSANLQNRIDEIGSEAYKNSGLSGHMTKAKFSSLLSEIGDDFKPSPKLTNELKRYFHDQGAINNAVHSLQALRRDFNKINYGYESWKAVKAHIDDFRKKNPQSAKLDDHKIAMLIAPNDTILSYYRNSFSAFKQIYKDSVGKNAQFVEELQTYAEDIDTFRPAKDYLPSKKQEADSVAELMESLSGFDGMPKIPSFLKEKKSKETQGDYLTLAKHNLSYFAYVSNKMNNAAFANFADKTVDELAKTDFFFSKKGKITSGTYYAIKDYVENTWKVFKNDFRHKESEGEQALRDLSNAINLVPASMMAIASTAANNIVGGIFQLGASFGFKNAARYLGKSEDLKHKNPELFGLVENLVSSDINGLGKPEEFRQLDEKIVDGNGRSFLRKVTTTARDLSNKVADISTRYGIVPVSSTIFSLKGSEEKLRNAATRMLYEKVEEQIELNRNQYYNNKGELKRDKAQALMDELSHETFYEINYALGNFDTSNKPFFSHAMDKGYLGSGKNAATRMAMVQLGAAGKLWYMFRKVAQTNFDILTSDTFKAFSGKTTDFKGNKLHGGSGLLVGLVLVLAQWAMKKDKKLVRPSIVKATDPLEGANGAINLLYSLSPLVSDIKIPESEYKEVMEDNIRWAGGLLAGSSLEELATSRADKRENAELFRETVTELALQHNIGYNLYRAAKAGVDIVGIASKPVDTDVDTRGMNKEQAKDALYYSTRNKLHERSVAMKEALGSLYKLDYVYLFERLSEVAGMPAKTEYGKQIRGRERAKQLERFALSLAGLGVSSAPELYKISPNARAKAKESAETFGWGATNLNNEWKRKNIEYYYNQINRYGRIYL